MPASLVLLALALSFALAPAAAGAPRAAGIYEIFFPAILGKPARVLIPAGPFLMGCDPAHNGGFLCDVDELPLHTVSLSAYTIDIAEVTNSRYAACVADGACTLPSDLSSATRLDYYSNPDYADFPVIYVNWYQAQAYCEWAGGSLPTEAQWENAARGPLDTRAYPWGDALNTCELANAKVGEIPCAGDTTIVGRFTPAGDSPYGLHDMAGNVYEWVKDWYSDDYYENSPPIDPTGPETGTAKMRRSGAFGSYSPFLRVAVRLPTTPDTTRSYIGFRCAYPP